jgi:hypothetical protein
VTRRLQRRPDEPDAERERDAAAGAQAEPALLELQRSAGNAAVARVLARQESGPVSLQFTKPAPVVGGFNPFLTYQGPKLEPDVERAVDAWLTDQKTGIGIQIGRGATSVPEIVDQVRRHVPLAADAKAEAIRARMDVILGPVPATRTKPSLAGQKAEQEARISNLFPTPPTSVTFGGSQTSVTVGISGADLKAQPGISAKADKEGAEAEVEKGGVTVGASGKWDGSEFGLKTEVGGVKFESKIHHKGDGWGWSGGLVIPLSGEEVDELPDVSAAVGGAHAAITESFGHLRAGGSLTDGYVTERMGKVKPAIDAAKNIAGRTKPGATLRVTAGADGGGWTAGVSLVIVF